MPGASVAAPSASPLAGTAVYTMLPQFLKCRIRPRRSGGPETLHSSQALLALQDLQGEAARCGQNVQRPNNPSLGKTRNGTPALRRLDPMSSEAASMGKGQRHQSVPRQPGDVRGASGGVPACPSAPSKRCFPQRLSQCWALAKETKATQAA